MFLTRRVVWKLARFIFFRLNQMSDFFGISKDRVYTFVLNGEKWISNTLLFVFTRKVSGKRTLRRPALLSINFLFWSVVRFVFVVDYNISIVGQFTLKTFVSTLFVVAIILLFGESLFLVFATLAERRPLYGLKIDPVLGLSMHHFLIVFLLGFLVIVSYGFDLYGYIPKGWGGGAPLPVKVFFDKEATGNYLGVRVNESGISEPLCLLAELYDGLLFYNPRDRQSYIMSIGAQSSYIGHATSQEKICCGPPDSETNAPAKMAGKGDSDQSSSEEITTCT